MAPAVVSRSRAITSSRFRYSQPCSPQNHDHSRLTHSDLLNYSPFAEIEIRFHLWDQTGRWAFGFHRKGSDQWFRTWLAAFCWSFFQPFSYPPPSRKQRSTNLSFAAGSLTRITQPFQGPRSGRPPATDSTPLPQSAIAMVSFH